MVDPLHINVDGMRGMSAVHDAVAEALGGLQVGDAPLSTHGAVASPVTSTLSGVLGARGDVLRSTSASGRQISSLLQGAADAYRSGDEHGADALRTAAQPMDGSSSVGAAAAAPPVGNADPLAAAGQVGQVVGQVVQSVTQPLQSLAQSLGQLPGQLLGGLGGLSGLGGVNGGGIGNAAGLSAPLEHPTPPDHQGSAPDHAGSPGAHHGSSHAHELRRDHDPERADEHPESETDKDGESDAQELDAAAPAARRPAATRPQD